MAAPASPGPQPDEPIVAALIDRAARHVPEAYRPFVLGTKPVIVGISDAADAAWPYCMAAYRAGERGYKRLEPYHPEQYLPLAFGLAMCFFGGSYLTLCAAIEAVRLSVWQQLRDSVATLYRNAKVARTASRKDDVLDDNNDGVADVKQISSKELLSRKLYVVATAIDPEQTMQAARCLWTGFLSVLATVRVRLAGAVTLGCGLGDMFGDVVGPRVEPTVKELLPPELKKWSRRVVSNGTLVVGILLAFMIQRFIGGFHSAVRGARIAVDAGSDVAKSRGWVRHDFDPTSKEGSMVAALLAAFGFYWQLGSGFAVPFPFNLLLLPASILEGCLQVSLAFLV